MNKKFSTLVATLLLSGALFTLNAAPVEDLSSITGIEIVDKTATTPKTIKFTKNVTLSDKEYILIEENDVVIDGQGKYKLNGHIVITGENCTVKGLTINFTNPFTGTEHDNTEGNGTWPSNRGAIVVKANKVTITDNKITAKVGDNSSNLKADGIILLPSKEEVEYTITGNEITATAIANGTEGSVGIALWENLALNGDEVTPAVELSKSPSFDLTQIKECAVDYQYASYEGYVNDADQFFGMPVKEAVVTPNETNAVALQDIVKRSSEESEVTFNGSAEELAEALGDNFKTNISITTDDGEIISGVKQLLKEVTVGDYTFDFVSNPSANEYYRLFHMGGDGKMYLVTIDETTKKPSLKDVGGNAAESDLTDNSLFKMEVKQQGHADNYTFTFVSKSGLPLLTGKDNANTYIESDYNYTVNGAVFDLNGVDLTTEDGGLAYFGLYKSSLYTLTANDLKNIEGDGFSITIKPDDLVGNPFAGRLTPMNWSGREFIETVGEGIEEYYLMNADGDYIVAKLFGAEGGNKNQAFYVFTTVSAEDLAKDLVKADKDRTLFGQFKMYYKPTSADDDMLEIKSIESMKVEVLNKNNKLEYAPVGYANISTTDQTEKTLTASLKSTQYPITITVGNNIVKPEDFLKKAFYTVTKIDEKEGNTILAATSCKGETDFVESVGNDLEAQWAITYDEKAAIYTFKNREQLEATWSVDVNDLREDDNTKDDIYVIDGVSYQIATVADAKESDGYLWLGDVKNQRYAMGYYVKALEEGEYLWFVGDKEGNISFEKSSDASVATEMKFVGEMKDNKPVVDTVKVTSTIKYYDAAKKKFATTDSVLKVPVYTFANVDGENFGYNGKQYVFGAEKADSLTIRVDNGQYNLRLATKSTDGKAIFANDKIYAGASADYLDQTSCVYDDTKNDLFTVAALNRPEYRRLGATVENDGLKDMDVNTVKINRSNDENTYLYENSANRNANNGDPILNFLGETNLADQPENASLAIFVDTAYVRNETTKLFLAQIMDSILTVRTGHRQLLTIA